MPLQDSRDFQEVSARTISGFASALDDAEPLLGAAGVQSIVPGDVLEGANFFVTIQFVDTPGNLKIEDINGVERTLPAKYFSGQLPYAVLAKRVFSVAGGGGTNEILVGVA